MKTISAAAALLALTGALFGAGAAGQSGPQLEAQDYLDIRQLIDAYTHLLDNCTNGGKDYADLFTDDATFGVAVLTTPGHTQGSTIYTLDDRVVLSGDTLFVDGVGRPDLAERAEEFARNLYRSLLGLGDDALVLPGHYGDHVVVRPDKPVGATLGELRATLPELALDEDGFVKWATARATPRPPNYAEIITVNMGRRELPTDAVRALEAGPNRCSV